MSETISKHIGEGFGKGELYAALAYDATDAFSGMKIKSIMHDTTYREYFRDSDLYIYSSVDGQLDMIGNTKIQITAPTIDLEASSTIALDGDVAIDGAHTFATGTGVVTLGGNVTISGTKTLTTGTGASTLNGTVSLVPLGNYYNQEGMNDRYRLTWVAGQRGKPGINADILNTTEATREIADPDFEVLGTNGSSDDVTFYAEGGITLITDGADLDSIIILPHLDSSQSAWKEITWGTDKQVRWECEIKTGAAITNSVIYAGLKLTNTEVTATDADQVFFRYQNGVNTGKWQAVNSIADTDDAHDSGVTVAINTVYHLVIEITAARLAKFYINGSLVETSTALTDAVDLIPYIGIKASGAAEAKTLYIRGQAISRAY